MVFLIQNTQSRAGLAMHLKLDELIAAVKEAHNDMIDIESLRRCRARADSPALREREAGGERRRARGSRACGPPSLTLRLPALPGR